MFGPVRSYFQRAKKLFYKHSYSWYKIFLTLATYSDRCIHFELD